MHRAGSTIEQRLLLLSCGATLALATTGVCIGLWSGSRSIVFDGIFDIVDAAMTVSAWFVARLVTRGEDRRFQYGYWHIEPMLVFLNSALLLLACICAFTDATGSIIAGGRRVDVGIGIGYAASSAIASLAIFLFVRARGRALGSACSISTPVPG